MLLSDQPELQLPDPYAPQEIEVSNNEYIAKVGELKAQGYIIERIKVISGGYPLTVRLEADF